MLPELQELQRIRLDEDLSYEELADRIGLKDNSTLHRLLNNPDRIPFDRTLHKIRRFLEERKAAAEAAAAPKRTGARR
jgi:transcriptional regulator with XRE-family HTH domain